MVNICENIVSKYYPGCLLLHEDSMYTLPGVLLGVFDKLCDMFAVFPGVRADVFDELAFLCHLAMGAFVMGISSFKILWMSFSNTNCAIFFSFHATWTSSHKKTRYVIAAGKYY